VERARHSIAVRGIWVGTGEGPQQEAGVPTDTSYRLYDLTSLEPVLGSGQILLTPNYRLARRIKSEWDRRQIELGLAAWQPVPVYPLEHWLQQRWEQALVAGQVEPRVLLNAVQVRELWSQVIGEDQRGFDASALLQSTAAADLAQEARDNLIRWQVDVTATGAHSEFRLDTDCATFLRWLDKFEAVLQKRGLATRADLFRDLFLAEVSRAPDPVALVDFDDLPPLHEALLDKLVGGVVSVSGARGSADAVARAYPDRRAELSAIASWAAENHRTDPQRTLGILLGDMQGDRATLEYLLRDTFDCLGENYTALPVNFSTGLSLDRVPVVRDALIMLSAGGYEMPLPDLLVVLRSRFIRVPDRFDVQVVRLLQRLYEDGAQRLDTARLRHLSAQSAGSEGQGLVLGEVLLSLAKLRLARQQHPPSGWVECLHEVLKIWGWPGPGPLDSLEHQQLETFYEVLEALAGFDATNGKLGYLEAVSLLRRCCQNRMSQPQTADSHIQVLGPLEAAGLHFDAIWVCGMQGSRWPAPARPNPFIPLSVQRRHQMPHATSEREWTYANGLFQHYRGACDLLIASHARQLDGVPELPSPLLEGLEQEPCEEPVELPEAWLHQLHGADVEWLQEHRAPVVESGELNSLSRGSGLLQDQANCPFRAFAARRLGLAPLGDYHSGLSAADRGNILHNALYVLWGGLRDSSVLQGMDSGTLAVAIDRAARAAIEEVPQGLRQLVGMACLDLEARRLGTLLREWLALERSREPFSVAAREHPVAMRVGPLSFDLRVDRIDRLAGGETLVIDYKSGRNSLSDWLGDRPAQPQLPLYSLAADVDALAFAQVRARDCRMLGLGETGGIAGVRQDIEKAVANRSQACDWVGLKAEWATNLEQLAQSFVCGEAGVDPLPGACNYCGLQALCRVDLAREESA